jgi:hypothetical protein
MTTTIQLEKWTARERAMARRICLDLFKTTYRNAAVLKRIAALRAARTIITTLEGGE